MPPVHNQREVEKLLVEADELIRQLNSGLIDYMEDHKRAELETHARELEKRRDQVMARREKPERSDFGSSSEGMHQAIDDIVNALRTLVRDLT
ncbi:MAG TPA: hypothetical protein VLT88_07615 [Desulfosarcina sp.]|nr:hypothetical protein [Desulfosarcina sp.]